MAKCGKGYMPECQYFTTGGCISPFCPYKIETGYINTATSAIGSYTQGKDDLNEPKIKKWFRSLVEEGKIQQEPMNYDAATLKIYIDHLEKENAALRERLEKAVELPVKIGDTVYKVYDKCDMRYCLYNGYSGQWRCHYEGKRRCAPFIKIKQFCYADIPFVNKTVFVSREAAEAQLKQMQGEQNG